MAQSSDKSLAQSSGKSLAQSSDKSLAQSSDNSLAQSSGKSSVNKKRKINPKSWGDIQIDKGLMSLDTKAKHILPAHYNDEDIDILSPAQTKNKNQTKSKQTFTALYNDEDSDISPAQYNEDIIKHIYIYPERDAYHKGDKCQVRDQNGKWHQATIICNDTKNWGIVTLTSGLKEIIVSWGYITQQLRLQVPHLDGIDEKIRVGIEWPNTTDRTADGQLLLFHFCRNQIRGDGHCLYRSLSVNIFKSEDNHIQIRRQICAVLECYFDLFVELLIQFNCPDYGTNKIECGKYLQNYILNHKCDAFGNFGNYLPGEANGKIHKLRWGDHFDLIAFCLYYNTAVYVMQYSPSTRIMCYRIYPGG